MMTEKAKVEKVSLEGMDPTKPFFLACSVVNNDGSIADFNAGGGEGVEAASELEAECIERLKELIEEYPAIEGYVFHCVPVKKVWKGHVKVTSLGKKKS
jgi:hypothetical protein